MEVYHKNRLEDLERKYERDLKLLPKVSNLFNEVFIKHAHTII